MGPMIANEAIYYAVVYYTAVFCAVFGCVCGDWEIGFQGPRHRYKAFHHWEQELLSMIYLYTTDRAAMLL